MKALGKGLGNGLKAVGQQTAKLLPGLLGSVISFLFKTAGQAIGFLAEHAWLLVVAVVAFVMERYIKKESLKSVGRAPHPHQETSGDKINAA